MALFVGGIFGDALRSQVRTGTANTIMKRAYVAIGASGAATVTTSDGITCVKNTTGVYDVTYAISTAVSATNQPSVRAWVYSPATTVANAYVKAFTPASGTCQIVTFLNTAGTPVEPASGDVLWIEIALSDAVNG